MRRAHALRAVLALLLLPLFIPLPQVSAGTADDPETTDPAGDVAVTDGLLTAADFPGVDLRKAWVTHTPGATTLTVIIESAAAPAADAKTHLSFGVGDSLVRADATGTTLNQAPAGASLTSDGTRLEFTFPLTSVDAKPRDSVTDLTVTRTQSKAQPVAILPQQTATDRMPDSGAGRAYDIPKAPSNPAIRLEILGGTIQENGRTRDFTGPNAATADPAAQATWRMRITNAGDTNDTFHLTATHDAATFDRPAFTLAPNGTATANVTHGLNGRTMTMRLNATSEEGATDNASITLTLISTGKNGGEPMTGPPPRTVDDSRVPIPAWSAPLTSVATSIGFVPLFGPFAEVGVVIMGFLALVVLAVLVIFIVAIVRG